MLSESVVTAKSPLGELRALRRGGFGDMGRLRELLGQLRDTLDLEVAGGLLTGDERARLRDKGTLREQRVALLGSSTFSALPNLLTAMMVQRGILPELRLGGFNQWRFDALGSDAELRALKPRLVACLLDDQALFENVRDPLDFAAVEDACAAFPAQLGQWVDACQAGLGGSVVLCTLPLTPLRSDRVIDYRNKARLSAAFARMNAGILELAVNKPRTIVLDAASIANRAGVTFADDRLRHTSAQVYAHDFLKAYAAELTRIALADLGLSRKCLVLDLDHTLWGGVVGDDGVAGLRLGGAYPGSAHQELQALARDLMAQGVMLTVCSKNDEDVAREAMTTHPEMLLKPEAFVAVSANWQPKPENVRAQLERLNIGADALVFMDDNPAERELMRRSLPQVETVELPKDPASYAALLATRGDFNLLEVTEEDRTRTTMYRAQVDRAELERSSENLEDYLLSLRSELTLQPLSPLNQARIVQLFAKTNQFNLTGVRFSEQEVVARAAEKSCAFIGARLTDRFGDNGLIAALAIGKEPDGCWSIENFVLSCRVFSRNVEEALIGLVLSAACARGVSAVHARFIETPKNKKFASFYPRLGFCGFAADGVRSFIHPLQGLPSMPRWIQVKQDMGVFDAL
jgi:FkbH-like protein